MYEYELILCIAVNTFSTNKYCIMGNFRGRRLLQISWFCCYCFLSEIWGHGVFGAAKVSNPRKFSPRKSYFSPICESVLPRKFPAVWYIQRCGRTLLVQHCILQLCILLVLYDASWIVFMIFISQL